MYVLQLINQQRSRFGGEESVIQAIEQVLATSGHETARYERSSRDIEGNLAAKLGAAWSGIHSIRSTRELRRLIRARRPDIVHAHNVYPLLSPAVFDVCRAEGVPAVMSVHSHILTCPNWYHLRDGRYCTDCRKGHEYRCLLTNCRDNVLESAAYAARSFIASRRGMFSRPGLVLLAVSDYLKRDLIDAGFDPVRIRVVPNGVIVSERPADPVPGGYVAFAGRLSEEKGMSVLLEAARTTGLPVRIAGDGPLRSELERIAPSNVTFLGRLDESTLTELYRGARMVAVPSVAPETFGLVAAEAMAQGIPVVASNLGALPELVGEGTTGRLFEPGNADALASIMTGLWNDPGSLRILGRTGHERIRSTYSSDRFAQSLLEAYEYAMTLGEST